jgi:hypothetical protein
MDERLAPVSMRFRLRVTTPGGVLEQEFDGVLERLLDRLVDLAAVVPKESTWEGTKWEKRR